jgi:hypothetical protein
MKPTSNEIKHKILHSGVFKVRSKCKISVNASKTDRVLIFSFQPIGLKEEAIGGVEPIEYDPCKLERMICEITDAIHTYLEPKKYPPDNVLESVLDDLVIDFDKELEAVLSRWGLSLNDLKPCHDTLINKAKRYIKNKKDIPLKGKKRSLAYVEKAMTRSLPVGIGTRVYMVDRIHEIFKDYNIKKTRTDITYHIVDLLIACGKYPADRREQVFNMLDTAFDRY